MTVRRLTAALGALLCAVPALVGLSVTPARAATQSVRLGANGPSPATLTIARGDTVRFTNGDGVSHTVTQTSGSWTFIATIAEGNSATTTALTSAATGGPRYADRSGVVQSSAHRYGLPIALAVVAVGGIASLLVRLLRAEPAARRRRTKPSPPRC